MKKTTFYQFLEVEPTASSEDISRAWQKRFRQYEASKEKGDPMAASFLLILNDARRVLLDAEKKELYDQKLKQDESAVTKKNATNLLKFSDIANKWVSLTTKVLGIFLLWSFVLMISFFYFGFQGVLIAGVTLFYVRVNYKNRAKIKKLNKDGFSGLSGAKELYFQGRIEDALLVGGRELCGTSKEQKISALKLHKDGFIGLNGAKKLFSQGRIEDALLVVDKELSGSTREQKILAFQGFFGLNGAIELYFQGRIEDALLVGGMELCGTSKEQKISALKLNKDGFIGLNGAKKLYFQGRIEDALLVGGREIEGVSQAEKILKLELVSFGKSSFIALDCRAENSGFLIDAQNKSLCFYTIKDILNVEKWRVEFKDVLGFSIVKNETQILETIKKHALGNALVGGYCLVGQVLLLVPPPHLQRQFRISNLIS